MPARPVFSNATATATVTASTVLPSAEATCEQQCMILFPDLQAVSWVPKVDVSFYTTITVGTVSIITTISGNLTSAPVTQTIPGDVDPIYDSWRALSTNSAGTAYLSLTITHEKGPSVTKLAYPTAYLDYATEYSWSGQLQTSSICSSVDDFEAAQLTAHPEYPQPTAEPPDGDDPVGAKYTPVWMDAAEFASQEFFQTAFPGDNAFAQCWSARGKRPGGLPVAPKFTYITISATSLPAVHVQKSTDGFESKIGPDKTVLIPPPQRTQIGFEETSSLTDPESTAQPTQVPSRINANVPDQPEITAPPPPVYTPPPVGSILVPTFINGRPTASPAYVVPGSFETATIGQTVTIDGRPTVIAPPPASFSVAPTVINGETTSAPVFIIDGTSTASVGQTVTFNGRSTVLSAPSAVFTMLPTTISGQATSTPVYIIGGAAIATIGQAVTVNGLPTVLSPPAPYLTMIRTTVDGKQTSVPAYIISGTSTAFPGQTITIDDQTTVLSSADITLTHIPTSINGVATSVPAYIISGQTTALPGQTMTINGQTTVLANPDVVLSSITTNIMGRMTVIPVYVISGSITAAPGQTVTLAGQPTVLPTVSTTSSSADPASTAFNGARETGKQNSAESTRVSLVLLLSSLACVVLYAG